MGVGLPRTARKADLKNGFVFNVDSPDWTGGDCTDQAIGWDDVKHLQTGTVSVTFDDYTRSDEGERRTVIWQAPLSNLTVKTTTKWHGHSLHKIRRASDAAFCCQSAGCRQRCLLLRAAFPLNSPLFNGEENNNVSMLEQFLSQPETLLKGPYLSAQLPFRKSDLPLNFFPNLTLPFPPHAHQAQAFQRTGIECLCRRWWRPGRVPVKRNVLCSRCLTIVLGYQGRC